MSTSPVSPEDIRAAAEVHRELGPEYSDAVIASFLEKVDRELAARVEARLAAAARTAPARRESRRALLQGLVIGACAGALAATVALELPAQHTQSAGGQSVSGGPAQIAPPRGFLPPIILTPDIRLERPGQVRPRA
jgi:ferric-dicitrate binding protein FerR (iron transport regulator)